MRLNQWQCLRWQSNHLFQVGNSLATYSAGATLLDQSLPADGGIQWYLLLVSTHGRKYKICGGDLGEGEGAVDRLSTVDFFYK